MLDLGTYHRIWKQEEVPPSRLPSSYPGWPAAGFALIGDFSGIQNFVFRPIPGAGGAARRLRSRSFRVSAYTEIISRWCLVQLAPYEARLLYSAGGRFLIGTPLFDCWEKTIEAMQASIDSWAWQNFEGELAFHLAAATFEAGRIPYAPLTAALLSRRKVALKYALQVSDDWSSEVFFRPASPGEGQCVACGITQRLHSTSDGETICDDCESDERIGKMLASANVARFSTDPTSSVNALNLGVELYPHPQQGMDGEWLSLGDMGAAHSWFLLHHVPKENGHALDFDALSDKAPGSRKWLGYLRIDVDHAGENFRRLQGDPLRTWALSRFLNTFLGGRANEILAAKYRYVYAVFGGGDDLFVIGPWSDLLDFALELRADLRAITSEDLSFSAGLSLAKPREHILTQARFAGEELEQAKEQLSFGRDVSRDQIRALGTTMDWKNFDELLATAKQVKTWQEEGLLPSSFLHQALRLHHDWSLALRKPHDQRRRLGSYRYKPLLYYQIQRNLKASPAKEWAHALLRSPSQWPWLDFIIRYSVLAAERGSDRGEE